MKWILFIILGVLPITDCQGMKAFWEDIKKDLKRTFIYDEFDEAREMLDPKSDHYLQQIKESQDYIHQLHRDNCPLEEKIEDLLYEYSELAMLTQYSDETLSKECCNQLLLLKNTKAKKEYAAQRDMIVQLIKQDNIYGKNVLLHALIALSPEKLQAVYQRKQKNDQELWNANDKKRFEELSALCKLVGTSAAIFHYKDQPSCPQNDRLLYDLLIDRAEYYSHHLELYAKEYSADLHKINSMQLAVLERNKYKKQKPFFKRYPQDLKRIAPKN